MGDIDVIDELSEVPGITVRKASSCSLVTFP